MKSSDPPGFDTARVEAWIAANVSSLTPPLAWRRFAKGHSNLTYLLTDANQHKAVIRRPPLGKLIPKAHDMRREWRLISALHGAPVPTPSALGFCDDASVADAPFYVMGYVEGHSLATSEDTLQHVPENFRENLGFEFIDILAALHQIDPADVGLSDLGRADNYLARQIGAWHKSWIASASPAQYDDPRIHDLRQLMLDNLPAAALTRIVHGDFGLHNCLVNSQGRIAAVVDWEICTLGDPLADLSYALQQFRETSDAAHPNPMAATAPPGFPDRAALARRYAAKRGIELADLDFYHGFNLWRKAAIAHGVYARYVEGKKDATGVRLEDFRTYIELTLEAANTALHRWRRA